MAEAKAGKSVRQIAEELGAEIYRQNSRYCPGFLPEELRTLLVKQSLQHEGIGIDS